MKNNGEYLLSLSKNNDKSKEIQQDECRGIWKALKALTWILSLKYVEIFMFKLYTHILGLSKAEE